ncbi:MAG TPA: sarcosine oxidase subunit gamma family protein, partial [Rhizobiaceae bacterium]|nr:sarcosine oxidase subunit gamma family protein [Rhizobiaceae bacterium]
MAEAARILPLENLAFALPGLSLLPATSAERISLRARPDAVDALGEAAGLALPRAPRTSASNDGVAALWLGPDEWLLIAKEGTGLAGRFSSLSGILYSAVDISHRNTAIIVEGAKAAVTLNSGCPQDLSLEAFPSGACARTILGKVEVILYRQGPDKFRVECWRS